MSLWRISQVLAISVIIPTRNQRPDCSAMEYPEKVPDIKTQGSNNSVKSQIEVDKKDADEALKALGIIEQDQIQHGSESDHRLRRKADLIIMPVSECIFDTQITT